MSTHPKVMMISRGHGWGHAVPDMAIAARVLEMQPDTELVYVSYADGAEAYRYFGHDVVDLDEPANPLVWDLLVKFNRLFVAHTPNLIVAHEEIAALTPARSINLRSLFVTDFFLDPSNIYTQALRHADEVLFSGTPGHFTVPPFIQDRLTYVGRTVRNFRYTSADRDRIRTELHIPHDALVLVCQPGTWTESDVSLGSLLKATWKRLPDPKRLVWTAGKEAKVLKKLFRDTADVQIVERDLHLDRLLACSDVLRACSRSDDCLLLCGVCSGPERSVVERSLHSADTRTMQGSLHCVRKERGLRSR